MTIHRVGFEKLRHVPREVWYVMFSCFILRPLVMYLVSAPFDLDPMMRKVFVAATMQVLKKVVGVFVLTLAIRNVYAVLGSVTYC